MGFIVGKVRGSNVWVEVVGRSWGDGIEFIGVGFMENSCKLDKF